MKTEIGYLDVKKILLRVDPVIAAAYLRRERPALAGRAELIRAADGIEAVLCHKRVVIVCKYIAFHMLPFATNGQIFATIRQNALPDIEEAAAV